MESAQVEPTKKPFLKRFWPLLIILFLFLILGTVGLFFFSNKKDNSQNSTLETGFAQTLTPKTSPTSEANAKVSKTIGPAGGIVQLKTQDYTYTLTVPQEVLPINYEVSLTPLTENPIAGYERPDFGYGVLVEPEGSLFGVPAYLSVVKTKSQESEKVVWGYCNIGSAGFDMEICLGEKEYPFNFGVDKGRVALLVDQETISFLPTVPSVEENQINARIWGGGVFLFDSVNKTELVQILKSEKFDSPDFASEVEPFAHLVAFGGLDKTYKEQIKDFSRSKSSFPRVNLEAIIVAATIGENKVAQEKLDQFFEEYEKNFNFIRSSYLPWMSYYATLLQLENLLVEYKDLSFIPRVSAGSKPPASKKASENFMSLDRDTYIKVLKQKEAIVKQARETLNKENLSPSERLDAIEILEAQKSATEEDRKKAAVVLEQAAEQAPTVSEAERIAEMAKKQKNTIAEYKAVARLQKLLEKYESCADTTKKTLSNFGMNDCP